MIVYRAFRNADTPRLVEIWRAQPAMRGLLQPMSTALFDHFVLSKSYFDRLGLIVAEDSDRLLGFVHAGFGPTESSDSLSTATGVVGMLMTRPEAFATVAEPLLTLAEKYLGERGSVTLYAGGVRPFDPFYLGLYGGSKLSGVFDAESPLRDLYQAHGYKAIAHTVVLERDLATLRLPVDRQQMQLKRHTTIKAECEPPSASWWEACTYGVFPRTRFVVQRPNMPAPAARVTFWDMAPLSTAWGVNAMGLVDLDVAPNERRQRMATYLLAESFRLLRAEGYTLVETQIAAENEIAIALFRKLGFQQVDATTGYRKAAGNVLT